MKEDKEGDFKKQHKASGVYIREKKGPRKRVASKEGRKVKKSLG